MSNIYDLALYALFDLGPVKQFEYRSDMLISRSAGDGMC